MAECKVNFLLRAADCLTSEKYAAIRTNLLARCQDYAHQGVKLPKKKFHVSMICQNCFTPWSYGRFTFRIKSERKKSNTKLKQKRRKNNLVKKLQEKPKNELVISCIVCKYKNHHTFEKPSIVKEQVLEITPCGKKRKKKDKFAGLSEKAVLSAGSNHLQNKKQISSKTLKDNTLQQNCINITPQQNVESVISRPIFESDISNAQFGNVTVNKMGNKKQKKNKVLAKVEKKQNKGNNSLKALAEILKKNEVADKTSGLRKLLKEV